MSDLNEIHEELDNLRSRVTVVEFNRDVDSESASDARIAARAADRNVSGFRAELREDLVKIQADVAQVIALLASNRNKPDEP